MESSLNRYHHSDVKSNWSTKNALLRGLHLNGKWGLVIALLQDLENFLRQTTPDESTGRFCAGGIFNMPSSGNLASESCKNKTVCDVNIFTDWT